MLNARTDTYFVPATGDPFAATIERAVRYIDAGADCIFVPGVVEEDTIRRLAGVITVGASRLDVDSISQPRFRDDMAKHAFRRGRPADVAHAHE